MPASQHTLPTLDKLRASVDPHIDARKIASAWFESFTNALAAGNSARALDHLVDDVFWRDTLALTWNLRTFQSTPEIKRFLDDQLPIIKPSTFILRKDHLELQQPYPDLAWIQGFFDFETTVGIASGVFRIVPLPDNVWKGHAIYTNLEDLKGHPEKIGPLRDYAPNHGKWASQRAREIEFLDEEPTVLIIGGGQSGLETAARLKHLSINALVVERNERIGDNWRKRYSALCLHDPVWYDHMPYLPFPPSWPVYTPALKLADWLESYASTMELNVWTSAIVESVRKGTNKRYTVLVKRADGRERSFEVDHVVFALGIGAGIGNYPKYPGMDEFKGQILHSSQHDKATDHSGKKVSVVGSCTSAHDICADYVEHGIDVTMIQRSPTYIMSTKEGMPRLLQIFWEEPLPTDIADRVNASFPNPLMKLVHIRVTKDIAEADKDLLEGLHARGFQTTLGDDDSGFLMLAWQRAGGYYLNVGASELIVEGRIKLKSGQKIDKFTPTGIQFEDGSHLDTDVVIFATGYGDARTAYTKILGEELGKHVTPIWGLNDEGEINGVATEVGLPGIWCLMGNLGMCRFYSKHVALQIKACEEGIFGRRYA